MTDYEHRLIGLVFTKARVKNTIKEEGDFNITPEQTSNQWKNKETGFESEYPEIQKNQFEMTEHIRFPIER